MAPFGFHRPSWAKKKPKTQQVPEQIYLSEDPYDSRAYTLSGGDQAQYMPTTTQVPTKANKWRTVLKRRPTQTAPVMDTVTPIHDRPFLDEQEELYHHEGAAVHHESQSGSSRSSHRRAHSEHSGMGGVARHDTGRSRAVTILPHDSASNVHVYGKPQKEHGRPLQGIVEEMSEGSYAEPLVHRPISPVITPIGVPHPGQPISIGPASVMQQPTGGSYHVRHHSTGEYNKHHDIGRGLHLHHPEKLDSRGKMPFTVTDAHGIKQDVQEIVLDGSGLQEIPMPSHGNVIFIVEEGVTLDVKDPETGEYIPLEQYYANLAARRAPVQQDQFVVVNGDASNIIVEDHDGKILHRGGQVSDEFIHNRSRSITHSDRSRRTHSGSVRSGSANVRHISGSHLSEHHEHGHEHEFVHEHEHELEHEHEPEDELEYENE